MAIALRVGLLAPSSGMDVNPCVVVQLHYIFSALQGQYLIATDDS